MFVVAELSSNHNKDLNLAKESIYAIKECGANAVKLQTYTPDSITLNCRSNIFKIKSNTIWDNKYLYDLYSDAYMPIEWNAELFGIANKIGLTCFSSVFDKQGVDLLEEIGNPIYKIASFEITDIPLIEYAASKNKPMILSTGIARHSEIKDAIDAIKRNHNKNITLLKCTSAYPAPINSLNISTMLSYPKQYGTKYGLSDHSLGINAAIIATTLRAEIFEKHFILDKKYNSVDKSFSMDRKEFAVLVKIIKETKEAIGSINYDIEYRGQSSGIEPILGREFARSLFVSKNIKKGDVINTNNIRTARPNAGIEPKYINDIIGKRATKDLEFGKPLSWDDFA